MTSKKINARRLALNALMAVLVHKRSLTDALIQQHQYADERDTGLLQELCFGVLRHYFSLSELLQHRLKKPLRDKDADIHTLLLIGLYQIRHMRIRPHALVNETVTITKDIKKQWASGLVNALLRGYLRDADASTENTRTAHPHTEHPPWLIQQIKADWPDHWQRILLANNQRPPMTLRINACKTTLQEYCKQLDDKGLSYAIIPDLSHGLHLIRPTPIDTLPLFQQGHLSIQDASAQLTAHLLQMQPGMTVLDACAAPGGKTTHLAELQPHLESITAIDIDQKRAEKISENIQRLQHKRITIVTADAAQPDTWWDGKLFDRILLDAPCSGSGVIRRHPDIKFLRQPTDIANTALQQKKLLQRLWPLLKSGGMLLYSTCSIIKQENSAVISAFMQEVSCMEVKIDTPSGRRLSVGTQILPGEGTFNGDGFYFACLLKQGEYEPSIK